MYLFNIDPFVPRTKLEIPAFANIHLLNNVICKLVGREISKLISVEC